MPKRAMIVVAAGESSRFGSDKIMADVAGRPLIWHTMQAVIHSVDGCILVARPEVIDRLMAFELGASIVEGGPTRTASEAAGLAAADADAELIGIHDGARPAVTPVLVERLFVEAERVGGAVPTVEGMFLDRETGRPMPGVAGVQTPQVFRAKDLRAAYGELRRGSGHDTVEIVQRHGEVRVSAVPGDPENIKVTYADDLVVVREILEERIHSEPR